MKECQNFRYTCLDIAPLKLMSLDFRYLVKQAVKNNFVPQLYNFLTENLDKDNLKQNSVIDHLHQLFNNRIETNKLLLSEFTRIFRRMKRKGIDIMPIKGIALMTTPYFGIDQRETRDIDLLTPTRIMYERAKAEMLKESYLPKEKLMWMGEGYAWAPHLLKKLDDKKWVSVDIHETSVVRHQWAGRPSMNLPEVWSRRREYNFSGMKVYVPSPEDCVRISCAHIFYDAEFDLRTLFDIVGVLRLYRKTFNWRYLIRAFIRGRSETNLYFPLCIVYRTLLEVGVTDLVSDLKKALDKLEFHLNQRGRERVEYWKTVAHYSSLSFPKDVFSHTYKNHLAVFSYWGYLEP